MTFYYCHYNCGYNHRCNGVFYTDLVPGINNKDHKSVNGTTAFIVSRKKKSKGMLLENETVNVWSAKYRTAF